MTAGRGSVHPPTWSGRLVIESSWIGYFGPGGPARPHRHHTFQAVSVFSPRSTVGQPPRDASWLAPDAWHDLDSTGAMLALLMIEPAGGWGAAARRVTDDLGVEGLSAGLARRGAPDWRGSTASLLRWGRETLALLCPVLAADRPPPPPIRRALEYIHGHLVASVTLDGAARAAGLSPGRLTHVFSATVGLPFRRYVVWARVKAAAAYMADGGTLTEAAAAAGFSDQAHLSRSFREMVGLRPSEMLPRIEVLTTHALEDRAVGGGDYG